jgi:hypothetical protein
MDKKQLLGILDGELAKAGFHRRSSTWYLDEGEIIKVVNLQKSSYSNTYYVNLCIYIKALGSAVKNPKEDECHIRTRLDSTLGQTPKKYDYLFDLSRVHVNEKDDETNLVECVRRGILPQLDRIRSREGILTIAAENPAIINMLPSKVRLFFGLEGHRVTH